MKKLFRLFAVLVLTGLPLFARGQGQYWPTFDDMCHQRGIATQCKLSPVKFGKKAKALGGDFEVIGSTRADRKKVERARFVQTGEHLFVNLHGLQVENARFGGYFSLAYPVDSDKVVLVAIQLTDRITDEIPTFIDGLLDVQPLRRNAFGELEDDDNLITRMVNHAITKRRLKRQIARRQCAYLYSAQTPKQIYPINKTLMGYILRKNGSLLMEYYGLPPEDQLAPEVIMSFIDRSGLIRKIKK